jgi:hypothetical protein
MAASIPVLRVLVRDVSTSAGRYYGYVRETGKAGGSGTGAGENSRGTVRSTYRTVITANRENGENNRDSHGLRGVSSTSPLGVSGSGEDDESGKSILEAAPPAVTVTVPGKILQTSEVRLEYSRRAGEEEGYEMDRVQHMV